MCPEFVMSRYFELMGEKTWFGKPRVCYTEGLLYRKDF